MRLETHTCTRLAALLVAFALPLTGCVQAPARQNAPPEPVLTSPSPPDPVVDLLDYAHRLQEAEPEQRMQRVIESRQAVRDAPGAWTYARLALAYGTPNQRRYTPDEAARYAQLALEANDAAWSDAAHQYLSEYARLYALLTQPEDTGNPTADDATADANARDPERQRIHQLQNQLDEAHRKLRELADIEDRLSTDNP